MQDERELNVERQYHNLLMIYSQTNFLTMISIVW